MTPNALKLSDAEGWAGLLRKQETCAARSIRCSAWLGRHRESRSISGRQRWNLDETWRKGKPKTWRLKKKSIRCGARLGAFAGSALLSATSCSPRDEEGNCELHHPKEERKNGASGERKRHGGDGENNKGKRG